MVLKTLLILEYNIVARSWKD